MESIKKIKNLLMGSIFEVFERMYYIFSEPLKELNGKYQIQSTINFSGSANGQIQIFLTKDTAEIMVKNMLNLGTDEINLPIIADCVKESLNMICGNFLRKLDPDKVYNLSIPTFDLIPDDGDIDMASDDNDRVDLAFATGGGNVRVIMTLQNIRQTA
jgi:CheY-specific phosphatase CheX